jgi:two-component system nitrogen regulation sensor histidine kinase NtrY
MTFAPPAFKQRIFHPLVRLSQHPAFQRILTYGLIVIAFIGFLATAVAFKHADFWDSDPTTLVILLNIDLVILLLLGLVIVRHLTKLWAARKTGQAGAKLHVRFVAIFSSLTVVPIILLTTFLWLLFNNGLQTWFNDQIKTAVRESPKVAEAYLEEHKKVISANVTSMALSLAQELNMLMQDQTLFNAALDMHAEARGLDEALVFNNTPEVLAKSRLSFALEFEVVTPEELEHAKSRVVIRTSTNGDRVRALTKISPHMDAYLLVGRIVDPKVLKRIKEVEAAVRTYQELEKHHKQVALYFLLICMALSLLMLLSAIWVALVSATRIVRPISGLIDAAENLAKGDFKQRVQEKVGDDEINLLVRAFNRMTRQLGDQQEKLLHANMMIDSRRQFIEDVLKGVSAGVMSVDMDHCVLILNDSARNHLNKKQVSIPCPLEKIFPEVLPLVSQLSPQFPFIQSQLKVRQGDNFHILMVRVVQESPNGVPEGYIITFDDITELVSAQRKAAWADVARRIAHEIRNPLTPIQLSAERLQRKYSAQITQDKDKFDGCVDTIVRQVTHIGDMVKEFSNFARMPDPKMKREDLAKIVTQAVHHEKIAHSNIEFVLEKSAPLYHFCDAAQLMHVMTNLLQNAVDAIEEQHRTSSSLSKNRPPTPDRIQVWLESFEKSITINIMDTGVGFPQSDRETLTEPYVTHKEKGTGLGLAIVKKIVEDHEAQLILDNNPEGGAWVKIVFNRKDGSRI